jgi:WD40 repeat protein
VGFQNVGTCLASASLDGGLAIWNPGRSKRPIAEFEFIEGYATQLAWSPDDSQLAVGTDDGALAVFALE